MPAKIRSVTFDTNVLPAKELAQRAEDIGIDVQITTVTQREVEGWSAEEVAERFKAVPEVFVLGESRLGEAVLAGDADVDDFELALELISSGSFPRPGSRDSLQPGQRRQLRDAMILCAHVRTGRDVLVTNDRAAFMAHGRREAIREHFSTDVVSVAEFEDYLASVAE